MTRDEACKILNIEERPELNHVDVMEVRLLTYMSVAL